MSQTKKYVFAGIGIVALQAAAVYLMGHPAICACGYVKFWEGAVLSPEMSQHISDWYTFSHIIHGFIFYLVLRLIFPKMSPWKRLVFAIGIEAAWEIAENTPMVINAYRQQALAQGYTGDSVLNSVCDTFAMIFGFVLARKLPVYVTVSLAIIFELFVGYYIHDNLTLNVLNFIHPFQFIHDWQANV